MNKLTKVGVSALCGSLAAVSAANAGDLTVTGGVDMSWISKENAAVNNPIGIGSNLTFTGSGETDGGITIDLSVAYANLAGYSNTNVTLGVPGFGDIRIDQGTSGTGLDRIDDVIPTAWEEAYGSGLSGSIQTIDGSSVGSTIELTPSEIMPEGLTARFAWSPKADAKNGGDKGSGVKDSAIGSGYDVTVVADSAFSGVEGMTLYAGMSKIEQDSTSISTSTVTSDASQYTLAAKYAMGSFTVGYQWSRDNTQSTNGTNFYENDGYGVVFAVNDDLSLSYGKYESTKDHTNGTDVTTEASAVQVAYSMGGASVRLAHTSIDDGGYTSGTANDVDGTTLSLALAF